MTAGIDAVLIASSTDTHVDLIVAAAQAGKAVFCEKPIDLSLQRVETCWEQARDCGVPIQTGFNRRYDAPTAACANGWPPAKSAPCTK